MRYSKLLVSSSLIAMLGLSACGGGGGDASTPSSQTGVKTGVFLDSAVEGLNYSCLSSGLHGKTNANGEYNYKDGDVCTFSIGGMELGTAKAKGIMTPLDIIQFYNGEENKFRNVLRLLQTLDQDGNASNGIVLPNVDGNITGGFNVVESSFASAFQDFLDANEINASIVSSADATQHFQQTLSNEFDANLSDAMFEDKMINIDGTQIILKTDKSMEIFSAGDDAPCSGSWSLSDDHTLLVSATVCGLFRPILLTNPQEYQFMFADTPAQGVSVVHYDGNQSTLFEVDTFIDAVAPSAPTDVTYSDVNQTSFTINWKNSSENETVNKVACYKDANIQTQPMFQFLPGSSATGFSVTYTGLDIDTLYACRVDSSNIMGLVSADIVNVRTDSNTSSDTNSSSDTNNTLASIDVRELNGYTVITNYKSATTSGNAVMTNKSYIFGPNLAVDVVFDRKDGGQTVFSGTYKLSDVTGTVSLEFQLDETTLLAYTLMYDQSDHLLYPQVYNSLMMTIEKIIANEQNGITIQDDQPIVGTNAFTLSSASDLKGYTISSNVSDLFQATESIKFNCDGSADTTTTTVAAGHEDISTEHSNVEIRTHDNITYYLETLGRSLLLTTTNQLIIDETCWDGFTTQGSCLDNWKIQSIEQTEVCQ